MVLKYFLDYTKEKYYQQITCVYFHHSKLTMCFSSMCAFLAPPPFCCGRFGDDFFFLIPTGL